jgi:hypothetical protein
MSHVVPLITPASVVRMLQYVIGYSTFVGATALYRNVGHTHPVTRLSIAEELRAYAWST